MHTFTHAPTIKDIRVSYKELRQYQYAPVSDRYQRNRTLYRTRKGWIVYK